MAWPKGTPRLHDKTGHALTLEAVQAVMAQRAEGVHGADTADAVFIADSLMPKQVRWKGYEAMRPWVARHAQPVPDEI